MTGAVVLAAGASTRAGRDKTSAVVLGLPLVEWATLPFVRTPLVEEVVLVASERNRALCEGLASKYPKVCRVVAGGATRSASARAGLSAARGDRVLVHDGARPLVPLSLVERVAKAAAEHGCAVPVVPLEDSVRDEAKNEPLPRSGVVRVQTPQGFERTALLEAYAASAEGADDAGVFQRATGKAPHLVAGAKGNLKVTTPEDFELVERALSAAKRVAFGYDVHPREAGVPLVVCGVTVPDAAGCVGHSDGDAALHAVTDALLAVAGLGDIGTLFPDDAEETLGASSLGMLGEAVSLARTEGCVPVAADVTVVTSGVPLSPHREAMLGALAGALGTQRVSAKFRSGNGVGAAGRGEALEAYALVEAVDLSEPT